MKQKTGRYNVRFLKTNRNTHNLMNQKEKTGFTIETHAISGLVLQSHTHPLPAKWIASCLKSVKAWADLNTFDYLFLGDELFDYIPNRLLEKTQSQRVIATDLARLRALQFYLKQGYDTVIWCDADFLIFTPSRFKLTLDKYAVGREVWIQNNIKNPQKLTAHIKVHNAFMMYRQGNAFLDFYADTAERLLTLNQGPMPPQFIGPKLLTAIHNVAQCPVQESAGMLSPLVIKDIANHDGPALKLFQQKSPQPIYAANLCSSLHPNSKDLEQSIRLVLSKRSL